jgi:hypothetical protein
VFSKLAHLLLSAPQFDVFLFQALDPLAKKLVPMTRVNRQAADSPASQRQHPQKQHDEAEGNPDPIGIPWGVAALSSASGRSKDEDRQPQHGKAVSPDLYGASQLWSNTLQIHTFKPE